jgi:hypothetical protein
MKGLVLAGVVLGGLGVLLGRELPGLKRYQKISAM